jgi:hypothetical protein
MTRKTLLQYNIDKNVFSLLIRVNGEWSMVNEEPLSENGHPLPPIGGAI